MDWAEDMIIDRRNTLRTKRVSELQKNTDVKIPMRERLNFIEPKIEGDFVYFGSTVKQGDKEDLYLQDLKKVLRQND
jgi:hypothetical protein